MFASKTFKAFCLLWLLATAALSAQAPVATTASQFLSSYKSNLAADAAGEFTRLTDPDVEQAFTDLVDALLAGDLVAANDQIDALELLDVHYQLIEITDAPGQLQVLGFREAVPRSHADFKGWGPVLVRPHGALDVVYQAPHPIDDQFTEKIMLDAYLGDASAAVALFSGSRRHSNGDGDGDGQEDSDVAHDTENLFHLMTVHLASVTAAEPAFYVQVHAAANRTGEPLITGSDGADRPPEPDITNGHPLVAIDDAVDADGHLSMGLCSFSEGPGDDEDGDYELCATTNLQGDFLETVDQREQFMHFELQRTARLSYDAGSGPGYDGIRGLFTALRSTLGPELQIASITTPAEACQGEMLAGRVAVTVENAGDVAIPHNFHFAWYLSDDEVFDAQDEQLRNAYKQIYPLGAGQQVEIKPGDVRLPTSATMGSHYLLAVVDYNDQVLERIESNNVLAFPLEINCTVLTDFEETFSSGWAQDDNLTTAESGFFGFGRPNEVVSSGVRTQVDGNHTPGGKTALYTTHNTSAGVTDVDNGQSVTVSPAYAIDVDSDVSIWYYHGQRDAGGDAGDFFRIETSIDGGPYSTLVSYGDETVQAAWQEATLFVAAGQTVRFRVRVADGPTRGDLVEAGLDDVISRPR